MGRHKGDGRRPGEVYIWTPAKVARMTDYAARGFSMRETAIMLGTTTASIAQSASRRGITFNASVGGAPKYNRNAQKAR